MCVFILSIYNDDVWFFVYQCWTIFTIYKHTHIYLYLIKQNQMQHAGQGPPMSGPFVKCHFPAQMYETVETTVTMWWRSESFYTEESTGGRGVAMPASRRPPRCRCTRAPHRAAPFQHTDSSGPQEGPASHFHLVCIHEHLAEDSVMQLDVNKLTSSSCKWLQSPCVQQIEFWEATYSCNCCPVLV